MKLVEINRADAFVVSWITYHGIQERRFHDRKQAEAFAWKKAGKTGGVLSTLDMTPEQLEAEQERRRRAREAWRAAR